IAPTEDQPNCRYWFNIPTDDMDRNQGVTMRFDYPVKGQIRNGILDQARLVVTGPAYASDVFAIPSVENGELGLEIEVTNPGDEPLTVSIENEIVPLDGGPAAKTFEAADLAVPAGEVAGLSLAEPFPDARLWWPDDPYQYEVVTTLRTGDEVLDIKRTKFGFRQWTIQGTRFVLNGIPWQLRANLDYYGASPGEEDEAVAAWAETGQNMFRLRFQSEWAGMTQNQALDFFDQAGVPVRKTCSTFDGQHASYRLVDWVEEDGERRKVPNAPLFENWRNQIHHRVRQMRNHPSIFVWELDNEIIYINTRNFGNLDVVEPEFTRASEMILEMDPSGRGVMVAGGRALMDQSLPINGGHYEASPLRDYPDMSYGLGEWTSTARHQVWPMAYDKPIFLSEEYFASGPNPDWFAAVGGEVCFLGRAETRDACGLIGEMYSEGYRWQELGGFHYWTSKSNGASYYESWQPVLALCREWNWSFASGAQVSRTVMVRNDTRQDTPIDLEWEVTTSGGERVAGETLTLRIPPGEGEITEISFGLPEVTDRTAGTLSFICHRDGEEVWSEASALSILPPSSPPAAGDQSIVVLDPDGAVIDRLAAAGTELAQVATLEEVPDEFDLLIVGRDALTPREATDPRWLAWASEGRRVLVLEQETPLHYQAVPADFEPTDYVGRVAFPENLEHPVFEGLAMEDFFTWSGDHVVYRNPYRKASRGARSLAQCDESLSCSALAQCPVDDGLLLLCQMVVGEKLDTDPVAQRLFDNMVSHALAYERVRSQTALVMDASDPRADMIASTALEYTPVGDPVAALSDEGNDIVIVDASPGSLADLAAASDQVRSFTDRGGWLMLWGVTPEGLEAFNEIVGVDHLMRPFRMEKVALKAPRDPLASGLSQRDVVLYSGERIFGWTADEWLADDVFSYVVDLDEVAPFAEGDAIEGSSSVVNAMTSVDAWKYIYYMPMNEDGSPQTATWRLPRAETITGFSVVPNPHYWYLTRIKLVFDGDEATAQVLDLDDYTADANPRQDFELTPVTASQVTLVPLEWRENPGQAILGLDNIWLHVERPEDFHSGVKALTNIGALVKYPRGEGGIVLNQLLAKESETVPINAEKKRNVFATLMANLGAVFAGGEEALTTANLSYEPISLEGLCNLYITSEGGWPGGERDLSRLPLGEQRMAGVTYEIRDFETSPLEHAITLQGLGGIDAPASVTIPVGQAADALFFLHTWWRHGNDPPGGDEEAPIVFEYVVQYEDGRSEVVPVHHGRGVAHWVTDEPKGLRDAMVAWEAPLEGTDERAVLYSMQWTNPHPESVIDSVELRYNPDVGGRWGAPVLLAVTAAQERE
ncbi:MAG: hypothetical protein GF320_01545, partial [Armatimonadia bacterium]|nr:hypothetical protein [Armatimonadia bacterium]